MLRNQQVHAQCAHQENKPQFDFIPIHSKIAYSTFVRAKFYLQGYGAGTSSRTAPILEQIPKNSPKKQELAGNSHTS